MHTGLNRWLGGAVAIAATIAFVWVINGMPAADPSVVLGEELPASENVSQTPEILLSGNTIDLSQWHFDTQGGVELREGWMVRRDALVEPRRFIESGCRPETQGGSFSPISLPDIWGPALTNEIETGHGRATYCLEIETSKTDQFLALRLGSLRSVSTVYAIYKEGVGDDWHIETLYRNGDPMEAPRKDAGNPASPVIQLPRDVAHLKIVIHLANYVHKQGGMVDVPVIDYQSRLEARYRRDGALPTALVLVLFLTSLGTFLAGRFYAEPVRYNIFAMLSFASAMRVLFVSDVVWDYFPTFSLARKYDLEYLSLFLVLAAYYAFIQMLFRPGKLNLFDVFVYGVTGLVSLYALIVAPFFPPGTVTLLREPVQVLWLVIALIVAYTIFKALFVDNRAKLDVVLVLIAASTMSGYEVLSGFGVITTSMEWSQVLVLFVTLVHVRAFQVNYREVEQERDNLNSNLVAANESLEAQAENLKHALVQAEGASRAKNEFLAVMSHELRTPLNAIIGFSEVMSMQMFGPMGDERYKTYANDITGSGQHLLSIVNDILDISRVESGNDEMFDEEVVLSELGPAIVRLVSTQAIDADVTCLLDISSDMPLLYGDERKLKQILINLMSNAIKFNVPGGTVKLKAYVDGDQIALSVKDSGVIPPKKSGLEK